MKMQILDFSLCIIEQFIFYIFFNTLFKKRFTSAAPLILTILIMSIVSLASGNMNIALRSAVCIFLTTASCKILYREKIYVYTAFSATILYMLYVVDVIFGNLFSLIFLANITDVFYSRFSYRLIVCLIIKIVNIVSISSVYRFFSKSGLNLKRYVWVLFNIVMYVFLFLSVVYMMLYPKSNYSSEIIILYLIISLSFFIMSFIVIYFITRICASFNFEKKFYLMESNYAALRDNMAFQNSSSEKIKKSRHDMKRHLMTVRTLLESENISEAKQLLDELEEQINSIKIELSESTGNPLIDAVILQNAAICESKHISFSYELTVLPKLNIGNADLSSLLSNLLSNAVEASENSEEPFVKLSISTYKSFLSIAVKNSCCHSASASENKLISSKDDGEFHGYGTQIISDIASKYAGEYLWESYPTYFWSSVLLSID